MAYGEVFTSIALLSFGVFTLLTGLFAAYFGMGKSRTIGYVLMVVAVLSGLIWAALVWPVLPGIEPTWDSDTVLIALIAVVGAGVGAIVSVALFLASIMKA
jgi:uncharacterized membrane-anchored protein YitT (DUF2179 family)